MAKLKVDQVLRRAKTHERNDEVDQARTLYRSILEVFPKNARAQQGLAKLTRPAPASDAIAHPPEAKVRALLALYHAGKHTEMIAQADPLLQQYPKSFMLWSMVGASQRRLGQMQDAEDAFRKASAINPNSPDTYKNLGMTLIELGKFKDAINIYQRLIGLTPDYAAAYNNMGLALRQLGQPDDAIDAFRQAIAKAPDYAEAYNNMGLTLFDQGKDDDALDAYRRAIDLQPDYVAAHYNSGNALKRKQAFPEAIAAYKNAIALKPDYPNALNNLGNTLCAQGLFQDAIETLQKASTLQPTNAAIHNNIGNVWLERNDFRTAQKLYEQALSIKPDYAEAHNNRGVTLHEQGLFDGALVAFRKAIELRSGFAEAYSNMGNTLTELGLLDEAVIAYRQTVTLDPASVAAECSMLHQMQHACDWSGFDHMSSTMTQLGVTGNAVSPFSVLSMEDHPERQMARARAWVDQTFKRATLPILSTSKKESDRIHIGYFSADMHDHPCLYLLLGMLRCHDKSRFEVSIFSYGSRKAGHLRPRAQAAVDHFHDVADMPNGALFAFARSQNLDLAIDLMGHTQHSRLDLFKDRLAPLQVSYIGFPGTTGAEFIDYLVGDPTVISAEHRHSYSENILYMPHTYLPNDNTLPISGTPSKRSDHGLPEDAFVFCCFNNNYKISPREFDIWMRLLGKVEDSVLWMLKSNRFSEANLRKEAQARGIDPARIIVGDKLSHPKHLERHRHADVFVDTFNYNAHTTASEALWTGLPLVTKIGEQFASRVAASMLTSIGLPELITTTEEDYEALLLDLATDREKVRRLKDKLNTNLRSQPLFDTEGYTRAFENGMRQAYDLYLDGAAPRDLWCKDSPSTPHQV